MTETRIQNAVEFSSLEDFAAYLGYDHPEEIHIVAHYEGFYSTDEQGDRQLDKDGINDFLRRLGADLRVDSLASGIYCIMEGVKC